MDRPETRYADVGDAHIAYQVVGDGPIDLVFVQAISGIGVHIASRVMGEAAAGELVCSRTVKDLVVGSGFSFDDRGTRELKGIPDDWQLFAVRA